MLKNVFLDFLDLESRQIFGLFENFPHNKHLNYLLEALNVAVFLCADFCIVPPGFLAVDRTAKEVSSRRAEFWGERLIRMPIREDSLDAFWAKKEREYAPFQEGYPGLFREKDRNIIKRYSESLVSRKSHVALEITKAWEEGPDSHKGWSNALKSVTGTEIERIRKIPRLISDEGLAVTWPAIASRIGGKSGTDPKIFRYVLQYHYFSVYIKEFDLRVITSLPFARADFFLGTGDLCYDYDALKGALSAIKLWDAIRSMSAVSLIALRATSGYFAFREAFDQIAFRSTAPNQVARVFAFGTQRLSRILAESQLDGRHYDKTPKGLDFTKEGIDSISFRLESIAAEINPELNEDVGPATFQTPKKARGRWVNISMDSSRKDFVAVFVALQMEREIVTKHWGLTRKYPSEVWAGKLGSLDVVVFGRDEMGRVPAAIDTMKLLYKIGLPKLLIVTGIAGGFREESVELGDILVATSIADMASRKVNEGETGIIPEFRTKEFRVDKRIEDYLKSNSFDRGLWERKVLDETEWPDSRRPAIRYGPLASLDEVISSGEWIKNLRKAWPKLLGVEMEAGGVCAAAETLGLEVAVLRGISDYADPSKSDTEWRRRAMKTVIHLLGSINYEAILSGGE